MSNPKPMTIAQQKFINSLLKKYTPDLQEYVTEEGLLKLQEYATQTESKALTKEDASEAIKDLLHFDEKYLNKEKLKEEGRVHDHGETPEYGWGFDYAVSNSRAKCRVCSKKIGPVKRPKLAEMTLKRKPNTKLAEMTSHKPSPKPPPKVLRIFYWTPGMNDAIMTKYYHPECVVDYLIEKPCMERNRINDKFDLKRALTGKLPNGNNVTIEKGDKIRVKKMFKEYFKVQNTVYQEDFAFNKILGSWLKK